MDICHKSHITQQSHEIDKKLHYDEPTLHYPSITEPTLHYPLITIVHSKGLHKGIFTNQKTTNPAWQGHT